MLRIWRWGDDPGLCGWARCNHKGFYKWKEVSGGSEPKEEMRRVMAEQWSRSWSNEIAGRVTWPKECSKSWKPGKIRGVDFPCSIQRNTSLGTLILAQRSPCRAYILQNGRNINGLFSAPKLVVICYSSTWNLAHHETGPALNVSHTFLLDSYQSFIVKVTKYCLEW